MTGSKPMLTSEDVRKVAPALDAYTQNRLLGDVWKRTGLAPRDRSIVTLAALIAAKAPSARASIAFISLLHKSMRTQPPNRMTRGLI